MGLAYIENRPIRFQLTVKYRVGSQYILYSTVYCMQCLYLVLHENVLVLYFRKTSCENLFLVEKNVFKIPKVQF